MAKIDLERREALLEVSPLIRGTVAPAADFVPLHALATDRRAEPVAYTELSPVHDFAAKLRQPSVIDRLRTYVRWQAAWRAGYRQQIRLEEALESAPTDAPLSINLDLTTACNYRCDHCVDLEILNSGIRYDHQRLKESLERLAHNGLRSVILIGGGEPTVYPGFAEVVQQLKTSGIAVGIVTNGGRMQRVAAIADLLGPRDWIRLSLDAGTDDTFGEMHRPHRDNITLSTICREVSAIKQRHPHVPIGFSYIIVWNDCTANGAKITENIDEIVPAARLARSHGFDYISYKPFLVRAPSNNAEIVALRSDGDGGESIVKRIRKQVERAKVLQRDGFRVLESTNLRVLENGSHRHYCEQPRTCHMQYFRQVLSPLGTYNCPVYRHVPQALLGSKHAHGMPQGVAATQRNALRLIESFDASKRCQEVTCLYNHANWFIEGLIRHPERLAALVPAAERHDHFL